MKYTAVTNNRLVYETYRDQIHMVYREDLDYMGILIQVRDRIHQGWKLLSHPLAGSVKPNQTPFRSILMEEGSSVTHAESVILIEDCIGVLRKFLGDHPAPSWPSDVLEDFQAVDLTLFESALDSMV